MVKTFKENLQEFQLSANSRYGQCQNIYQNIYLSYRDFKKSNNYINQHHRYIIYCETFQGFSCNLVKHWWRGGGNNSFMIHFLLLSSICLRMVDYSFSFRSWNGNVVHEKGWRAMYFKIVPFSFQKSFKFIPQIRWKLYNHLRFRINSKSSSYFWISQWFASKILLPWLYI